MVKEIVMLTLTLSIVLSGCKSPGPSFDDKIAKLKEIPLGVNKSEVIATIGEPESTDTSKDGRFEVCMYIREVTSGDVITVSFQDGVYTKGSVIVGTSVYALPGEPQRNAE